VSNYKNLGNVRMIKPKIASITMRSKTPMSNNRIGKSTFHIQDPAVYLSVLHFHTLSIGFCVCFQTNLKSSSTQFKFEFTQGCNGLMLSLTFLNYSDARTRSVLASQRFRLS